MLFIDSSYIIALMNKKARTHNKVKELWNYVKNETTLINSTVLLEILNNLKKRDMKIKERK